LHFDFTAPVRFGDTLTAEATVEEVITERRIVNLSVACRNQRQEVVLKGRAVLKVLKEVVAE
jgi:3-hydroxybutyryl-CoA dehydratase